MSMPVTLAVALAVVVAVTLAVLGVLIHFLVVHVEHDVPGFVGLTAAATVAIALLLDVAAAMAMTLLLAVAAAGAMALLLAATVATGMAMTILLAVVLLPGVLGRRLAWAGHHLVRSGDLYVCDHLAGAGAS